MITMSNNIEQIAQQDQESFPRSQRPRWERI
jgi:hypothetical protein